jgi:L-alanine-DL-glutamate epimerase-like enolase superfamily enzyme
MKIRTVQATNLEIPYSVPYRPAWQPGLVRTSREATLVVVRTEDGIVGYAAADGHHAGNVARNVAPYLVGQDAWATERHARTFRNAGGTWFIDQALWDIIGKAARLPLFKLWGAVRDRVPAYASTAELGSPENRAALARQYRAEGFRAMKLRFHHEELTDDLALLDAVQKAVPDLALMVDANQATVLPAPSPPPTWDYRRALVAARELAARGVLWLEEPLPKFDFDNLVRLCESAALPIAGGESNRELHEFRWLIERGVYDIVQPDCALSEGISQMRKIAALAEAFHRRCNPHHGLSGLGLAATLHLACTLPGTVWLEMMYEPPTRTLETYQRLGGILQTTIWIDDDGQVRPPDAPGLGVEVDESLIPRYAI